MRAIVDVSSLVVRYGEVSWPFRLDLDRGSASIELEDRTYEVCPLTWRAKIRLARFAQMDRSFVQARILEACLRAPKIVPTEQRDQTVLAALASWINLSFEQTLGLPLDSRQLAAVTVEVCRALRVGPMAFAEMSAPEVEMLWASLDQQTSEDEFVDPPITTPPRERLNSVNLSEPQFDTKIVILADQAETEDVRQSDLPEATIQVENSAPMHPAIDDAPAAVVAEASHEITMPSSRQAGVRERNPPARFRFSIDKSIATVSGNKATVAPRPLKQPVETRGSRPSGSEGRAPVGNADRSELSTGFEITSDNPAIELPTSPASPRVVVTTPAATGWPEFEKRDELESAPQLEDMDAVFDKFCERLAEAAEDLGILEEV